MGIEDSPLQDPLSFVLIVADELGPQGGEAYAQGSAYGVLEPEAASAAAEALNGGLAAALRPAAEADQVNSNQKLIPDLTSPMGNVHIPYDMLESGGGSTTANCTIMSYRLSLSNSSSCARRRSCWGSTLRRTAQRSACCRGVAWQSLWRVLLRLQHRAACPRGCPASLVFCQTPSRARCQASRGLYR